MNPSNLLQAALRNLLCAIQFLTRVPVSFKTCDSDTLAHSLSFFPVVGLLIGSLAALVYRSLSPHLTRPLVALLTLIFLVLITGSFHEDGLADAADGFGGGWNREQTLDIMRDSRIGTYGAVALVLSMLARLLLLSSIPVAEMFRYLVAAHVLCRWTTLPLGSFLYAARSQSGGGVDGQGARVAKLVSLKSLLAGTGITLVIVILALRGKALSALLAACLVVVVSGMFYSRRLAGVTGDCFGATNQLTEIAIYLCGAWIA